MRRWALAGVLGCAVALPGGAGAAGAAVTSGPPQVHERFTPLPCRGKPAERSTLELEGCAERDVLRLDRAINRAAAEVWAKLSDRTARGYFAAAQTAWIRFRAADCTSQADQYRNGTLRPVAYVECLRADDQVRNGQLRSILRGYSG